MLNTSLRIWSTFTLDNYLPMLSLLLVNNNALQVLEFGRLINFSRDDILNFYWALLSNSTLQKLVLCLDHVFHRGKEIFSCDLDSRLSIKYV